MSLLLLFHAVLLSLNLFCRLTFTCCVFYFIGQFPFDCQDLSCIIEGRSRIKKQGKREWIQGQKVTFLPELRKSNFASIDSQPHLQEWSLDGMTIDMQPHLSTRSGWPELIINVKLSRYWLSVIIQQLLVIFLSSLLTFVGLRIDIQEDGLADRVSFTLTLLLTVVLFDSGADHRSYLTFMDKYTLTTYAFLTMMMVENALEAEIEDDAGRAALHWMAVVLFVLYNGVFVRYAWQVRSKELRKLTMGYAEVEEYVSASTKDITLNNRSVRRSGKDGHNLIFGALSGDRNDG